MLMVMVNVDDDGDINGDDEIGNDGESDHDVDGYNDDLAH